MDVFAKRKEAITNIVKKTCQLGLISLALLPLSDALATYGKVSAGYSIKDQGMVGANTALPLDSISTATNPASIGWLDTRIDVGTTVFSPRRWYEATEPPGAGFPVAAGTHHSRRNYFFIPNLGFSRRFADGKGAYGMAIYGLGGQNTDWKLGTQGNGFGEGVFGAGNAGVDLMQAFLNLSLAWNFTPRFTVGASLIGGGQSFAAKGLGTFAPVSNKPNKLTNNDSDYSFGYGFKIGFLARVLDNLDIGGAYQSKIYMQKFDDYAGLFANNGSFDIEPISSIGLAWHITKALTTTLDAQYIDFNAVESIHNKNNCDFRSVCLGTSNGAGFGWQSIWIYKAGIQYQSSDVMTWRAGISYNKQPIPNSQMIFNILAPGVVKNHIAVGFSRLLGNDKSWEFNGFAEYVPANFEEGSNQFDPGQSISLAMRQYVFGFGISKIFK